MVSACKPGHRILLVPPLAGTTSPHHVLMSKPGRPPSLTVGTSGSSAKRFSEVTAIARSRPDLDVRHDGRHRIEIEVDLTAHQSMIDWPLPL